MHCFACFCFMFALSLEASMWVGKINSQKFLRDGTVLSCTTPLCRRLDSPCLKLSPSLVLNLWLGFQRQTKQKFSEYCFPRIKVTWCTRRVFCGLLFHQWEAILLFFLLFFTILFPNPIFLRLSKVHFSGALEGTNRNSCTWTEWFSPC